MTKPEIFKWRWLYFVLLPGCYGHTDFVIVEPVRFVMPSAKSVPNSRFGWLETSVDRAEGFRVRIGDITYQRIIQPYKKDGKITFDEAVSALSNFAESEVVRRRFCASATTPAESRRLHGLSTPPEMVIYVQCVK